jgi:aryl-phospho-beta-D-glucosidase BglC (GH1 family)
MKMYKMVTGLFFVHSVLILMNCSSSKPDLNTTTDLHKSEWEIKKQNALLGKCMNLGNALDAPTEGAWGVVLQDSYFSHVKQLGFQSVRIPIRWSTHIADSTTYQIDEVFFKRVEWAVKQSLGNGLRAIINTHHYEGLMNSPEKEKALFLAIWKQVSERFANYGPELYFELCNEPNGQLTPALWNSFAKEALNTVRKSNPHRSVIIGPGLWNSVDGLAEFHLPADSFLIMTVHYYKPESFTHQGAPWVQGSNGWLGTKWRANDADKKVIISHFNKVNEWASKTGVPVFLGEFGAYDLADTISRVLYTSFIAQEALARGWAYAYWKYSGDFGIYDDSTKYTREFIVNALLKPAEQFQIYAQKALADTQSVDPGSDHYVLLDDFEDTLKSQNNLSALYSIQKGKPAISSFGWWDIWCSGSSTISNNQGKQILPNVTDTSESSFGKLLGDWGKNGEGIHAVGKIKGDMYPGLGLNSNFTGEYNKDWFDLSQLTAVSFWAKGSGQMRIDFITDTILNGYPAGENWGHFGKDFGLNAEWTHYVFPVKNLAPKPWSVAQTRDKLTWSDGMKKVTSLLFSTNQTYDKVADDSLQIYLDDIRLYGVNNETFGLKTDK